MLAILFEISCLGLSMEEIQQGRNIILEFLALTIVLKKNRLYLRIPIDDFIRTKVSLYFNQKLQSIAIY